MKKLIKLTLILVFVVSGSSVFAQKFGRINMQELVAAMPETTEMQTKLEAFGKELNDNLESIQVEFNNKYIEYQKNEKTLSGAIREMKEKELGELQKRREEFSQVAQQEYQKEYARLLEPVITKAKEAVSKIAKAGNFTGIFDTAVGAMAYMDEATVVDVLPLVKTDLGIKDAPVVAAPVQ